MKTGQKIKQIGNTAVFIMLLISMFYFALPIVSIHGFLMSDTPDSLKFTYYGFATMAGICSVVFSWTRTKNQESFVFKRLIVAGQDVFLAAIIFLMTSGIKYLIINFDSQPEGFYKNTFIRDSSKWVMMFSFYLAIIFFFRGLIGLLALLMGIKTGKKLHRDEPEQITKDWLG